MRAPGAKADLAQAEQPQHIAKNHCFQQAAPREHMYCSQFSLAPVYSRCFWEMTLRLHWSVMVNIKLSHQLSLAGAWISQNQGQWVMEVWLQSTSHSLLGLSLPLKCLLSCKAVMSSPIVTQQQQQQQVPLFL